MSNCNASLIARPQTAMSRSYLCSYYTGHHAQSRPPEGAGLPGGRACSCASKVCVSCKNAVHIAMMLPS